MENFTLNSLTSNSLHIQLTSLVLSRRISSSLKVIVTSKLTLISARSLISSVQCSPAKTQISKNLILTHTTTLMPSMNGDIKFSQHCVSKVFHQLSLCFKISKQFLQPNKKMLRNYSSVTSPLNSKINSSASKENNHCFHS